MHKQKRPKRATGFRLTAARIIEARRFVNRFLAHPQELDAFLANAQAQQGSSDEDMETIRRTLLVLRKLRLESGALYELDKYLVGGMGAIDIVLLAMLIPLGTSDPSTTIALICLALSLVLVGASLIVSFVKKDLGISAYGRIHSTLITVALGSGLVALSATFWHVAWWLGLFFFVLATIAFVACTIYTIVVRGAVMYLKEFDTKPSSQHHTPPLSPQSESD